MMSDPMSKPEAGFTLIELLIALSMIGLITLLLFSGLRLGTNTWERVDARVEHLAELRAAHAFLVRSLNQLRPESVERDAEQHAIFAGDGEQLEFVAPLSRHVGLSGLYILRLSLEEYGAQRALVVSRWLLHPEVLAGTGESPPWTPLAEGGGSSIAGLEFDHGEGAFGRTLLLETVSEAFLIEYYGARADDSVPDWHAEWLDQPAPPQRVRLRLGATPSDWPDLELALVAPR